MCSPILLVRSKSGSQMVRVTLCILTGIPGSAFPMLCQIGVHHFLRITLSFFSCFTSALAYSFPSFPKSLE